MSNTNTGGSAFSQCVYNMKGGYDITGGMTLRDYFAAKAMQCYMHDVIWRTDTYELASKTAYALADAMLKAREVCETR